MQFAASPVTTKAYVGEGGSETAFLQHVRSLTAHASPSAASTAASSIVRAVLLASQASAEKVSKGTAPPSTTTSITTTSTVASVLPVSLTRRGVGPKDVLQQRLEKKRRLQQQQSDEVKSSTTLLQSHWSHRPLSAMNAASWAVFREQVGIELEVVNRRSVTGVEEKSRAPRYTIDTVHPIRCWEEAQLPYSLGRSVAWHYAMPTAIQAACVPLANAVRIDSTSSASAQINSNSNLSQEEYGDRKIDCLAVAETGSGKTAAYVIPMLSDILCNRPKLLGDLERMALGPYGLILVPTRELAEQVTREVHSLLHQTPQGPDPRRLTSNSSMSEAQLREWEAEELAALTSTTSSSSAEAYIATHNMLSELRVVKVVGGESSEAQYATLARGAHIVVGTIGQLRALLDERLLSLGNVAMCVIDEADRMLDEHQEDTLIAVLERCPRPRQTLMFTATLSAACVGLARRYLSPHGYFVVRCPHRCAAVTQCFELVAAEVSDAISEEAQPQSQREARTRLQHHNRRSGANSNTDMDQARSRTLPPSIHPDKFNRLVTWLAYATPPIVVFANEKKTCDALQEELSKERDHLARLEETFTLDALLGAAPAALSSPSSHASTNATQTLVTNTSDSSPAIRLQNLNSVAVVHADQSQAERTRQVQAVHRGERRVLLTTDLLARGLDIANVTLVINYDAPWPAPHEAAEEAVVRYVHRIGRTGRAGKTGVAVTFLTLPGRLLRRMSSTPMAAASQTSPLTRLYISERVRERETELRELTGKVDEAEDDEDEEDEDGEDDEDDMEENEEEERVNGTKRERTDEKQRHVRLRHEPGNDATNTTKSSCRTFASDEAILRPLWDFLCRCAEANGCKDGALALQRGSYAKIQLPAEFAELMRRLATRSSQFGAIVN